MSIDFFQTCPEQSYLPATVRHNMAGWFVEFYAFNPLIKKRERVKYRLNKYRQKFRTMTEFRVWTGQLCYSINAKLAAGWSPFGGITISAMPTEISSIHQTITQPMQGVPMQAADTPIVPLEAKPTRTAAPKKKSRKETLLTAIIDKFIEEKSQELRASTMRSYSSFCKNFQAWVKKNYPKITAQDFSREMATEYMEHVRMGNNSCSNAKCRKHNDGTVGNSTFNNNLKQGRALFSWAVDKCYCDLNPFEKIKTKREESKSRIIIPDEWRLKIREYFDEHNPQYLLICELVHTSLIRPIEISRLQVYMLHIEEGYILMPSTITKNHKERKARLSAELQEKLAAHIANAKPDDFLFANKTWSCGKHAMSSHTYGNVWEAMRKAIGLPKEMQLYSLRDTGINGMLKAGIDPLSVMQAADHSDLSMTTRYANHTDPELFKRLNELAPKF